MNLTSDFKNYPKIYDFYSRLYGKYKHNKFSPNFLSRCKKMTRSGYWKHHNYFSLTLPAASAKRCFSFPHPSATTTLGNPLLSFPELTTTARSTLVSRVGLLGCSIGFCGPRCMGPLLFCAGWACALRTNLYQVASCFFCCKPVVCCGLLLALHLLPRVFWCFIVISRLSFSARAGSEALLSTYLEGVLYTFPKWMNLF